MCEDYKSSLEDLTMNSKPRINMLTMVAEENLHQAKDIVKVIQDHIKNVSVDCMLPALYLIDSVIKNVGHDYLTLFNQVIVDIFSHIFFRVDEQTRAQLFKLRQTWTSLFTNKNLYLLDTEVKKLDPAWPITATPPSNSSIHVNPKFLEQSSAPEEKPTKISKENDPSNEKFDELKQKETVPKKHKETVVTKESPQPKNQSVNSRTSLIDPRLARREKKSTQNATSPIISTKETSKSSDTIIVTKDDKSKARSIVNKEVQEKLKSLKLKESQRDTDLPLTIKENLESSQNIPPVNKKISSSNKPEKKPDNSQKIVSKSPTKHSSKSKSKNTKLNQNVSNSIGQNNIRTELKRNRIPKEVKEDSFDNIEKNKKNETVMDFQTQEMETGEVTNNVLDVDLRIQPSQPQLEVKNISPPPKKIKPPTDDLFGDTDQDYRDSSQGWAKYKADHPDRNSPEPENVDSKPSASPIDPSNRLGDEEGSRSPDNDFSKGLKAKLMMSQQEEILKNLEKFKCGIISKEYYQDLRLKVMRLNSTDNEVINFEADLLKPKESDSATINIFGDCFPLHIVNEKSFIIKDGQVQEIYFQKSCRKVVYIDDKEINLGFEGEVKYLELDGIRHSFKFGVPSREIIIDEQPYELRFGEGPTNIKLGNGIHSIRLEGPPPLLEFSNTPRPDLVHLIPIVGGLQDLFPSKDVDMRTLSQKMPETIEDVDLRTKYLEPKHEGGDMHSQSPLEFDSKTISDRFGDGSPHGSDSLVDDRNPPEQSCDREQYKSKPSFRAGPEDYQWEEGSPSWRREPPPRRHQEWEKENSKEWQTLGHTPNQLGPNRLPPGPYGPQHQPSQTSGPFIPPPNQHILPRDQQPLPGGPRMLSSGQHGSSTGPRMPPPGQRMPGQHMPSPGGHHLPLQGGQHMPSQQQYNDSPRFRPWNPQQDKMDAPSGQFSRPPFKQEPQWNQSEQQMTQHSSSHFNSYDQRQGAHPHNIIHNNPPSLNHQLPNMPNAILHNQPSPYPSPSNNFNPNIQLPRNRPFNSFPNNQQMALNNPPPLPSNIPLQQGFLSHPPPRTPSYNPTPSPMQPLRSAEVSLLIPSQSSEPIPPPYIPANVSSRMGNRVTLLPTPAPLAPQVDINDLYSKLMKCGIILPPPAPAPQEPVVKKEEKEIKAEEKEEKPLPLALDPNILKVKRSEIINTLYFGNQCSSCGQRFSSKQMSRYGDHLDWHFRSNRREKNSLKKAFSRKWYYDKDEWAKFTEYEDPEERVPSFFEEQKEADKAPEPLKLPTVLAPMDEEENRCPPCEERFDIIWQEELEEWHLSNAIKEEDMYFHPLCYEDYKKARADEARAEEEAKRQLEKAEEDAKMALLKAEEDEKLELARKAEEEAKMEVEDVETTDKEEADKVVIKVENILEESSKDEEVDKMEVDDKTETDPQPNEKSMEENENNILEEEYVFDTPLEDSFEPPNLPSEDIVVVESGGVILKVKAESIAKPSTPQMDASKDVETDVEDEEEDFDPPTPDPKFTLITPVHRGAEQSGLCSIM